MKILKVVGQWVWSFIWQDFWEWLWDALAWTRASWILERRKRARKRREDIPDVYGG